MVYLDVFPLIQNKDANGLKLLLSKFSNYFDLNKRLDEDMLADTQHEDLYDYVNCTPIYMATKLGYKDIIAILLENGADSKKVISETDGLFVSSYDYTILNGKSEITEMFNKYLIENKSKSSIRTKKRPEHATSFNYKKQKNIISKVGSIQEF